MKPLKIAVIGAGSTYTPELIKGFIDRRGRLRAEQFYFMDIDTKKTETVAGLARRMLAKEGMDARITVTGSLDDAVRGANYVMGQVRIGGLAARIRDERIPMKHGLLGQETTGAGGFMNALRTIPVMMDVARAMERLAPDAWLINFSNPSGIVAEALLNHTNVKMAGLCNAPIKMVMDAKSRAPADVKDFDYDFVGLNHLCWVTAIYADGIEILQGQLRAAFNKNPDDEARLAVTTGGLPIGYLNYYYHRDRELAKCLNAEQTRGEQCREIESELLTLYDDAALDHAPDALAKRGGAMYSDAAVSLVASIENDGNELHVADVKNNGAFPFLDDDDVIETKCVVGRNGIIPVKLKLFGNQYIIGLVRAVKAYEKLTVAAAISGCRDTALAALMAHPLIGDYTKAKGVLDDMLAANADYLPQFYS